MDPLSELIGRSEAMEALRTHVRRLASTAFKGARQPPVLIQGETGTGKGLLARALHGISSRSQEPFVAINCAAIPEQLMESLLFGHEKGAYTGADRPRVGLLQSANRGVVFLDEIGLMPAGMQAKLLTAIEEGRVRRVGGTQPEHLDVWVISASNVDLRLAAQAAAFREDLYHRLARLTLTLPPLRERGGDVELLAETLLARICDEYGMPRRMFTQEALRSLRAYAWPGNVRELANVMERAVLMSDGPDVGEEALNLPRPPSMGGPAPREADLSGALRELHQRTLDETAGNISRTAERLGISRNTLRARIKRWNLRARPGGTLPKTAAGPPPPAPQEAGASAELPPSRSASAPSHIRWERRLITTLGVTLSSATATEPFELAPLLEELIGKARSFDGWVDELTPTSLVVSFGEPPAEDTQVRAAQAGRAILKAVERGLAREVPAATATVGIHARWCLVASGTEAHGIDSEDRRVTREVLQELTRLAPPQSIVVSSQASEPLQRRFVLETAGHSEIAGTCYRLVGGERSGFEVGGQSLSPLVGREQELGMLHELLARAEEGRSQIIGIVGDPGVGKSRLVHELRQGPARERATWLVGRCVSYRSTTPYHPIGDIVRAHFGVGESDPAEMVKERLRLGLEALELGADEWAPYLLHLLGIPAGVELLSSLTPQAIRRRILESLRQLALRGSRRRPIVFIVEDLQWIDPTSADVLTSLAESLHAAPIMMVATYRPGYRPAWLGRSYATQIALPRLSREDSLAIVRSVTPGSDLPESTARAILDHAEGVPFFLEEITRAVVEHGRLGSDLAIPDTVHGVIASRLGRLPIEDREALQVAAVIGGDVSMPVLAAVSGRAEADLAGALDRLQIAEFVYDSGASVATEYTFKHALTQEAAYLSLPDDRRRALHARTAEALERLSPEAPDRIPEVLAHHYTQADRRAQAVACWLRAGQRAVQRSASAEAIAHFTKGLDVLAVLPESNERIRQELALQMGLGVPLATTRGYGAPEVEQVLSRSRSLCQQVGESPELFMVCFGLWRFYVARADFPAAFGQADQLLGYAAQGHGEGLVTAAHVAAGVPRFYQGAFLEARHHFERAIDGYSSALSKSHVLAHGQDLGVAAWAFLGWTLGMLGYLDQAVKAVDRSVEMARVTGHPFSLALALHLAGMVCHLRGDADRAALLGDEELRISREQAFPFFLAGGLGFSGWARVCAADHEAGLRMMREGAETYRTTGAEVGIAHLAHLAEALVAAGCLEEAMTVLTDGLSKVEKNGERAYEAEFYRIKGLALLGLAPHETGEAASCFRLAIATARAQAARTLEVRTAVDLARLVSLQGKPDEARDVLAPLRGWFTEGETCRDVRAAGELWSRVAGG